MSTKEPKSSWPLPPITIVLILVVIAGIIYAAIMPMHNEEKKPMLLTFDSAEEGAIQNEVEGSDSTNGSQDTLLSDVEPLPINPAEDLDSTKLAKEALEEADLTEGKNYAYTVGPGDSFSGIASQYGFTLKELQEMNPTVDPGKVKIGVTKLKLKIKAVHIVGPGDILSKIATKYGVSKQALIRANKKKQDIALRGEEIIVPLK